MIVKIFFILVLAVSLSACVPNLGSSGGGSAAKPGTFEKGKAVKGFPSLPLYPKAQIIESYGSTTSFGASAISDDSISKVLDFYNLSLGQLGWEFKLNQNSETNFSFDVKNNKQQGTVIVNTAADGKKTAITISIAPR